MSPIEKALWYIETHLGKELSLDDIADAAGVSRFYLSRAFTQVLARPVMGYVRARRLSEAARALSVGADDILSVALDWGYSSHEAFTRAFRDQFAATPESVRANGLSALVLLESVHMSTTTKVILDPPRFIDSETLLLAGLSERYNITSTAGIPGQWARFAPHLGHIPNAVPDLAFGAVYNHDEAGNFDYMVCIQAKSFDDMPSDFARLRVPPQHYAIFTHKGHVSGVPATCQEIWKDWLPASGFDPADAPFLERYDERFDAMTGNGVVELWLAVRRRD